MEIKVYDRNLTDASTGTSRTQDTQKTENSASAGAQSSVRSSTSDQVQLSGTLGRLSQALSTQGAERTAKVASLAAAYRSGAYQPNAASAAARGLVAEALSAGGGQ